jgi:hypothetical protein
MTDIKNSFDETKDFLGRGNSPIQYDPSGSSQSNHSELHAGLVGHRGLFNSTPDPELTITTSV